jgi:probable rRNA maturation factor
MDSDGPSTVSVTITAASWQAALGDPEPLCRQAVIATLRRGARAPWLADAEISVLLCDDATMRGLNATYRGRDRATNVLAFPTLQLASDQALPPRSPPQRHVLLGDIVVAAETAQREAAAEGKPLADHLSHLLVHGCLHLLGHDHQDEAAARRMERLERAILDDLGIPDPYAGALPVSADACPLEAGR